VSHENLRAADFARSVDESLNALKVDYVDLLMVRLLRPLENCFGANDYEI
jgi:aryl-alcohol dehydrogenase-like predicted oxidoreductase